MPEQLYVYRWRNNAKRLTLHGRTCRVIARGKMNSVIVEFIENSERACVSRNALRKVKDA